MNKGGLNYLTNCEPPEHTFIIITTLLLYGILYCAGMREDDDEYCVASARLPSIMLYIISDSGQNANHVICIIIKHLYLQQRHCIMNTIYIMVYGVRVCSKS